MKNTKQTVSEFASEEVALKKSVSESCNTGMYADGVDVRTVSNVAEKKCKSKGGEGMRSGNSLLFLGCRHKGSVVVFYGKRRNGRSVMGS